MVDRRMKADGRLPPPMRLEDLKINRKSLTAHIKNMCMRRALPALKKVLDAADVVSTTSDIWLEAYTKVYYLGLTVHIWEDGKYELTAVFAHMKQWPVNAPKTWLEIEGEFDAQCSALAIDQTKMVVTHGGFLPVSLQSLVLGCWVVSWLSGCWLALW